MRRVGVVWPLLLLPLAIVSADLRIVPEEYSFGLLRETQGLQQGEVCLINDGTDPLTVRRLRATCGCTTVGDATGILAPGDSVEVQFAFNPEGRLGPFAKGVKVYTSLREEPFMIRLTGTVLAADTTLSTQFPLSIGPLHLDSDTVWVEGETMAMGSLHLYNNSDSTITPSVVIHNPEEIFVAKSSDEIAPGETATFIFTLRPGAEVCNILIGLPDHKPLPIEVRRKHQP